MTPQHFLLLVSTLCHVTPQAHSFLRIYNATRSLSNLLLKAPFLNTEDMSTEALAKRHGYQMETHHVQTEDGYILEMHRIPSGKKNVSGDSLRYPVIVQHGNFQSSADWLLNTPDDESLGFYLADNGYDVWLGNQRGNEYSTRHAYLPVHGSQFWNFSFHEMGLYDMPAQLDYVTNKTGKSKAHYISFSLGSTAFFSGLSKRADYNDKIGIGIMMGPSTFQTNFWHGWVQLVSPVVWVAQVLRKYTGDMAILPQFLANILHKFLPIVCDPRIDWFGLCLSVVQIGAGNDRGKISRERLHVVTKVSPSSSSVKAFLHEMQLMGTKRFCEFDYGSEKNNEIYGREHPPDYNLTNVRAPIALIIGENDLLASKEDAKTLGKILPNLVDFHSVPYEHFTHLDFVYASDVGALVYDHILKLLRQYDNS